MDFVTAVKTCVMQKYCCFEGRARRSEYWWFALASFICGMIPLIGFIASLALLLPGLGVCVRRLHDTGRSGWWLLLCLIPIVGGLVLIYFYICDSQPGNNKWGANPKGM
ncbi:MAG: DUF805 domain-containing protein [Bacteroidales bacterium]|nr:DUF805 domain-containing protein [Candidatus Liminaster caballi]